MEAVTRAGFLSTPARRRRRWRKVGWASKQQRREEAEKKEIKRQTVSKVPTRNTRARKENAVARIVELSIKENDPNCIERLLAHYEILRAIPAGITRVVEITYWPCRRRRREHRIVLLFFRGVYISEIYEYIGHTSLACEMTREKEKETKCKV